MEFELIKCKDASGYLNRSDVIFIDLREESRYREYHLPGAYSCPYEQMQVWEKKLPKGKKAIFYCEHGNLSLMAAKRVSKLGIRAAALIGGVDCFFKKNN